jgi:exodeoxyribonuclease V beta subunit
LGNPLQWKGVLSSLPWAEFVCAVEGLPPLPNEGLLKTVCSNPSLAPAPERRSYSFPFSAKRSFSSLSKSDQDHQVHAADRDQSQGADGEEKKDVVDLLQPLGDAGNILGDQMHHALENFLGNRLELGEAVAGLERAPAWEIAIREIVETPLVLGAAPSVTLGEVRAGCITEMQFQLPVDRLDPLALSGALAEDHLISGNSARLEWAKHLASWKFSDFTGFLQGFIDLIFEHEGRWYVADYKSNKLKGYDESALQAAMLKHNYLLQARIYNLALHRHLAHHLSHYDYDRDFGGVAYLFVRGFPGEGVWFERPDLASVERFGRFFKHHSSL